MRAKEVRAEVVKAKEVRVRAGEVRTKRRW
jgi:hypothetical protein